MTANWSQFLSSGREHFQNSLLESLRRFEDLSVIQTELSVVAAGHEYMVRQNTRRAQPEV